MLLASKSVFLATARDRRTVNVEDLFHDRMSHKILWYTKTYIFMKSEASAFVTLTNDCTFMLKGCETDEYEGCSSSLIVDIHAMI